MRIAGLVAITLAIAACGGSPPSGQTGATAIPETPETPAPSTSAPASDAAQASAGPTSAPSIAAPSIAAGTPLIDLLPTELGGIPTGKFAFVGSDIHDMSSSAAVIFESVVRQLGATGADMTIGLATSTKASVIAIRVTGKSAQEIGDAMIAGRTLNATTTKDELDLGGKHVIKVTTTIAPLPFYIYGTGDVSFMIAGADEAIVAEALSKLP